MQHRVVLNPNYNFQNWTGGVPDNWVIAGTNLVEQLDRHFDRNHPARKIFPSLMKSNDLVKDGDFAFRWKDNGATTGDLKTPVLRVAPGMKLSVSAMIRYTKRPIAVRFNIFLYDDLAKTTNLGEIRMPNPNPLQPGMVAADQHLPGNEASYRILASDVLLDSGGGTVDRQGLWTRQASSFEVPMGCYAIEAWFHWEGNGVPDEYLDVDDFRVEALDSRIHAGG